MSGFTQQMLGGERGDLCRGQLLLWDPIVCTTDRPDLTLPGPPVTTKGYVVASVLAHLLAPWHCDCHPSPRFLFSLLEKSGSVRGIVEWLHCASDESRQICCCCPAQRDGWVLPQSEAVYLTYLLIGTAFLSIDPAVLG